MIKVIPTSLGELAVGCYGERVMLCDWTASVKYPRHLVALRAICPEIGGSNPEDAILLDRAVAWIERYLAGDRERFRFEVQPVGTRFQKSVWNKLRGIPYGETMTYSALASALGQPRAVRAVANACASNPVSLFIPCHRVVGADGGLTGYAGGIAAKSALLSLEHSLTNMSDKN